MARTTLDIPGMEPLEVDVSLLGSRYVLLADRLDLPDGTLPRISRGTFQQGGRTIIGTIVKITIQRSDWRGNPSLHDVKFELVKDPVS